MSKTTMPRLLRCCGALLALVPALAFAAETPPPKELPPYGEDKPLPLPEVRESKLPNGLTVWIVPRSGIPKVSAVLAVRGGGTASDPADRRGIAEVLAEALRQGTPKRSARQIAEELQAVGASLTSFATDDALFLTANGLSHGADAVLDVLADVAANAAYPDAEVELAKTNALQALQALQADPSFYVDKAFASTLFGKHPYSFNSPEPATLQGITPDLLRAEHRRRVRPDRALLVVTGNIEAAAVAQSVERLFGVWKAAGAAPAATGAAPGTVSPSLLVLNRQGSVQSEIRVGRPTLKVTDPDYFPALVANTIFGGAFGSRLTRNIREEKGYTYSPSSRLQAFEQGGMLRVRAAVRNEVTAATLLEIIYELDRMGATLPDDEELARAKQYQRGLFLLRNETQGSLAQTLANNWVNGLAPKALAEWVPKINAVTAEQVRSVGRRLFGSRQQVVIVGGDAAAVKEQLAQFGEVREIAP
ncbi:MAG TPA: pitrilysin family protein [Thermoanaerobaculia bacterium]|nr:pitrilysin family protein [Thermoanaerobaculia bacterium]